MKILGHTFREMTAHDREGFAGASANALIAETDDIVLIWEPDRSELVAITEDGSEVVWKAVRA